MIDVVKRLRPYAGKICNFPKGAKVTQLKPRFHIDYTTFQTAKIEVTKGETVYMVEIPFRVCINRLLTELKPDELLFKGFIDGYKVEEMHMAITWTN